MRVYAVDVGTTNLKVVLYDEHLHRLSTAAAPAAYEREGGRVEFDPGQLFDTVLELIGRCARACGDVERHDAVIVVTGQAESLVLNDARGEPLRPGLSWLDDRAIAETDEIARRFDPGRAFAITGEPSPSASWPATKLRWLAKHEPATLVSTRAVLMVKDDLVRRFTGTAVGEVTTRGFTYFWDVQRGEYWHEMLEFCSVPSECLPVVVPAGTDVGGVVATVRDRLPPATGYRINVGALDHFCAMVGTGSYLDGVVSESAGTVLSLSMLAAEWSFDAERKVSFHEGLRPGDRILFNGVDAGGAALDWYRREGLGGMPYEELEHQLRSRHHGGAPLFLPYLTGVNPPDFYADARGAFLELSLAHDRIDMAFAVEEGIAHLLRRNVEYLAPGAVSEIVSTGGGAASAFWSQLKADVCGIDVIVPHEREATCRGAAILALVADGELGTLAEGEERNCSAASRFRAAHSAPRRERYRRFDHYLECLFRGGAREITR